MWGSEASTAGAGKRPNHLYPILGSILPMQGLGMPPSDVEDPGRRRIESQ